MPFLLECSDTVHLTTWVTDTKPRRLKSLFSQITCEAQHTPIGLTVIWHHNACSDESLLNLHVLAASHSPAMTHMSTEVQPNPELKKSPTYLSTEDKIRPRQDIVNGLIQPICHTFTRTHTHAHTLHRGVLSLWARHCGCCQVQMIAGYTQRKWGEEACAVGTSIP